MNIHSVAKKAGVSVATISRVFNSPEKVNSQTRAMILQIAEELGYEPNLSARTLRTNRSKTLGIILPSLLNPVFAECLNGIAQTAIQHGYAILPLTTNYVLDQEDHAVSKLLAANVEGIVLVVSNPDTSKALVRLQHSETPYILAYNKHHTHPYVSVDNEMAVTDLVKQLHQKGHQRMTMVCGTLQASDRAQQRYKGYLQGMQSEGLPYSDLVEVPFVETATETLIHYLQQKPHPTALICSNDLLAIRAIRAAHLSGYRVPDDISVIGFDGITLGQELTPSLCSIAQPNHDIGKVCVESLIQSIQSNQPLTSQQSQLLPYELLWRESCTSAAI